MLPSRLDEKILEAGCDEAGRGCLAGPVYAAAVILPADFRHPDLNDSKQLSAKKREELRIIIETESLAYAISFCLPQTIDKINILNASFEAMHHAVKRLKIKPEKLLIDGNRFKPFGDLPFECIVKGDGKIASIAAASILAKTSRDRYMQKQHMRYPHYGWITNKGYPTKEHRNAIVSHGITAIHRKSFQLFPLPKQLILNIQVREPSPESVDR